MKVNLRIEVPEPVARRLAAEAPRRWISAEMLVVETLHGRFGTDEVTLSGPGKPVSLRRLYRLW